MITRAQNARGYTLVEALISVLLLSVVLLGVYGVLLTGNTVFTKDSTLLDMEQQTRNAIDRIVREVRGASSQNITTNYNGTTNDYIQFFTPTAPTPNGLQYYLSGTNLVRVNNAGTAQNVASNIGLLKFSLTGSLLTIQATASKTIYSIAISFPLIEKVRLRNE